MKLTEYLFEKSDDILKKFLSHPFILGMADGSLEEERFKRYQVIDYAYLKEYVNVLAVGVRRTETFTEAEYLVSHMEATVRETLRSHVPYMEELGCYEDLKDIELPENALKYINYMIEVAENGKFLDCILVLLCCSWSYAYIAKNIVAKYPECTKQPLYGRWFSAYISKGYNDANAELMDMIDAYSEDLETADKEKYLEIFQKCCEYELAFWDLL